MEDSGDLHAIYPISIAEVFWRKNRAIYSEKWIATSELGFSLPLGIE
jgi:hypothetical protein